MRVAVALDALVAVVAHPGAAVAIGRALDALVVRLHKDVVVLAVRAAAAASRCTW